MTDLVGGVEPERQEWAPGQLARVTQWNGAASTAVWHQDHWIPLGIWTDLDGFEINPDRITSIEPLVAVPAGFGERLAQAIEGLRPDEPDEPIRFEAYESYGYDLGQIKALDSAAALVREQFTQLAGHDRNKT